MACDGGKDSLSMAASAGGETVKAPGNLVVSAYVTCPDITATVTPDLKLPGTGRLLHVDLAAGRRRLGGSNLAQAFSQVRVLNHQMRRSQQSCPQHSSLRCSIMHCKVLRIPHNCSVIIRFMMVTSQIICCIGLCNTRD